jgi:hypothetical protein
MLPAPVVVEERWQWLFHYTPKRATMHATTAYVFLPLDGIIMRYQPQLDRYSLPLQQLCYCYVVGAASSRQHPLLHLITIPTAGWISGYYDLTLLPSFVIILFMTICASILQHQAIAFNLIVLFVIFKRCFSVPTMYDLHPCAMFSVVLFCVIVIGLTESFRVNFEGQHQAMVASMVLCKWAFLLSSNDSNDSAVLLWMRRICGPVSVLVWLSTVNTAFYMMVLTRIYMFIFS